MAIKPNTDTKVLMDSFSPVSENTKVNGLMWKTEYAWRGRKRHLQYRLKGTVF